MYRCWIDLSVWKRWLWPNNWWSIRHLLPYHKEYHEAARFHDLWYDMWLISRWQIDDKFYQMMIKEKNTIYAKIYYIIVRVFWFLYYNRWKK